MLKPVIVSVVVILLTGGLLSPTEGLECYSCWNVATDSPDDLEQLLAQGAAATGNTSCARGRIPDETSKMTCTIQKDGDGKELTPICVQIYMGLSDTSKTPPVTYQVANRGCFYATENDELPKSGSSCSLTSKKELEAAAAEGPMKDVVTALFRQFTPNMTAEVCRCTVDNCNAASGIYAGSMMMSGSMILLLFLTHDFLSGW